MAYACPQCKRKFAGASGLWYHKVHKHGYQPKKRYKKRVIEKPAQDKPVLLPTSTKKQQQKKKKNHKNPKKKIVPSLTDDYCAVMDEASGKISVRIFNKRSDDLAWISSMLESEERKTVLGALRDWDLPIS